MIADPAVRTRSNALRSTYCRMAAIEGRAMGSIRSLKPQEACHEDLEPQPPTCFEAAGRSSAKPRSAAPHFLFSQAIAAATPTTRKPLTCP